VLILGGRDAAISCSDTKITKDTKTTQAPIRSRRCGRQSVFVVFVSLVVFVLKD
jgi:hypothetical protein